MGNRTTTITLAVSVIVALVAFKAHATLIDTFDQADASPTSVTGSGPNFFYLPFTGSGPIGGKRLFVGHDGHNGALGGSTTISINTAAGGSVTATSSTAPNVSLFYGSTINVFAATNPSGGAPPITTGANLGLSASATDAVKINVIGTPTNTSGDPTGKVLVRIDLFHYCPVNS